MATIIAGTSERVKRPVSADTRKVLRNVYLLLGLSLLPAIAGAYMGVAFPIFLALGTVGWLIFALVGIFFLPAMVEKNRNSTAGLAWLFVFTGFLGYLLGPLLTYVLRLGNGPELIAIAFGGTTATFLLMAAYATTTTRNYNTPGMRSTLSIGILMAFACSIISYLFAMEALAIAVSAVFIPIASMLIVHIINKVVRGGETNYISVTLTVSIMLFNIFSSMLHLLAIFGGRE